jgi:hypothetical protein
MRFRARQTLKPARDGVAVSFRHLPCQPLDEILYVLKAVESRGAGHVRRENHIFEREQLVVAASRLLVERVEREAAETARSQRLVNVSRTAVMEYAALLERQAASFICASCTRSMRCTSRNLSSTGRFPSSVSNAAANRDGPVIGLTIA